MPDIYVWGAYSLFFVLFLGLGLYYELQLKKIKNDDTSSDL